MKLKAKFTLIVSVFVVTLLALVAFFTFSHYKNSIKETIAQQQFRMLSILADEIDSKLLAAQQHLIAVADTAPRDIMQNPEKAQAFLDSLASLHIMFDNKVFLFTPSGKIFVESPDAPGRRGFDLSFREYIANTIKTNKPYISDPYVSSLPHRHPVLMFTAPLFDGKGKITGILGGGIDLMRDNFLGRIGTVNIGETGYFYLTSIDRTLIMHPDKKRILTKQAPGMNRLYDKAIEGFEGTDETTTSYGIKMVASFKRMKVKNWILMANSPQAEAYLPIRQAEQSLLIATVTGLIAIFFIISYIIKYLIKPLELFTRHIEDLPQKKGDDRFLNINTKDEIGTLSIAFNKMETERERAEEALQINADRVQALLNLNQMTDATLQQITGYALEESVRLSQSKIGYIAFLSEDETVLMMYSWSRQAMEECAIIDKPIHYMVSETGLWGEAVRQRQAVITNNYAAPNQWKKGYPAGHVTVRRHMNVPVFVGQHIVLVAGVGNKDAEYNETDVQQLTLLMDGMWQLIERKRAEEKYRTLFEESKDVVYMSTPDGRFLDMNLAGIELFGYSSKEELLATHITDDLYFKPEDRKDYEMMLFEKGFVKDYEIQMKNKNGKRLSILSTSSIVRDEQGAIKAYRGIMRDITEHKNLEQQLLHSQKMEAIGQLAGGIAHDFNNILTAIIGYGELAQMNVKDNEKIHGYMQQVLDAADRAKDLTKRLLAFSRKQVIETVLADLNDILRNIEKMLRRTIREDIDLRAVLSSGELPVMVDVGQIEQVLINLVANARDAMPEGGHLVIETDTANIDSRYAEAHIFENTGMYAVLTVSDTGIGMDQETRESIFEPFFTTKEVGKGTGLGLSMVYGIIKQHNGSINVYSEIGKGTTFRIYLPLVQTKIETISKPVQIPARGEGETIIIAEDEPQVRESMSLILQKSGYKIIEAENGQDAVKKFKDNRGTVSLVLLDVIMPVKNGLEAYEEIKEIDPSIKTIFMSGYTDVIISRKRLLEEGITFISKPINTATLMEKIRDTLDR